MGMVSEAVRVLSDAYAGGVPCPPLRGKLLPEGDVGTAYAVQLAQVNRWIEQGRRPVGAKIGLTSPAVQQALGVHQPDFGVLFADMAVPDGDEVDLGRLIQPRVEAEIAFVLGADLPYEQVTAVDVIRATDHLLPAIEIVDSRVADWDISIVDTVADNGVDTYVPALARQFTGLQVSVFLQVAGAGHYLSEYAGNLDILTSSLP